MSAASMFFVLTTATAAAASTTTTATTATSTAAAATARFFAALAHGASDRAIPLHPAQRLADPPLHATVRQPKRDAPEAQSGGGSSSSSSSTSAAAKRFWAALAYGASDRHIPLGSGTAGAADGESDVPPPDASQIRRSTPP
ncbi:hypothetical protein DFJ73DRAFT_945058 [Zopfochytrium polystomum]|nr:hypothetical protein DFJ73DRAFT_945058 [Zopfochytrium polystomum]